MKKLSLLIICLCISFCTVAQIQIVYVKTKGRLGSNGQVIPGQPIGGVVIKIKGLSNAFVSSHDGIISFPIPANKFFIQSVKKQGYVLSDPEATARQYTYSSNPLILVMETPSQLTDNKLANERKIRRTLQRKMQDKEDEIEALKEQNKITQEEYQKMLQQLYNEQENNEKLINDMAVRYSQIDFDQMNEFDRRINVCIMNGHLAEADSLLRSKGDISDRIAELQIKERLSIATQTIEASIKAHEEARMDLAEDCYRFHERFLIEQQYDSAAYYLERRAALDTTNVRWNLDAGKFVMNYLFSKQNESIAYNYFKKALQLSLGKDEEDLDLANTYMCLGDMNFKWSNYSEAYQSYDKAVHIFETFDINDIDACQCMERIALSYNSMKLHEKAIEQLLSTLSNYQTFHHERKDLIANCHINLGTAYENNKEYPQAFSHYENALLILDSITDRPIIEKAYCYNNMGSVCDKQELYDDAIKYYSSSLDIITKLKDLKIRQLDIGYIYNNLASTYFNQSNYKMALDYYIKSLHFLCSRLDKNHPTIKTIQENIIVTINEMAQSDSWEDEF